MPTPLKDCASCTYWTLSTDIYYNDFLFGHCHRHPPIVAVFPPYQLADLLANPGQCFPLSCSTWTCGEYTPRHTPNN